jgi:hypothetical protein
MRRLACLTVALAAALAGCGGGDEDEAAAPVPQPAGGNALSVVVTGAASQPIRMSLRCEATCDRKAVREAIAPRDPAAACTQQYGGPERAKVTGTFEGERVDVEITRTDGCGIAAYQVLFAAFGRQPPVAG